MAIATIQLDDGRVVKVQVPDGATQAQIGAFVQQNLASFSPTSTKSEVSREDAIANELIKAGVPVSVAQREAKRLSLQGLPSKAEQKDFVLGVPGAVPTMLSGVVAEPLAGLSGMVSAGLHGSQSGAQTVESVRDRLTIDPIGEKSTQTLSDIGQYLSSISGVGEKAGDIAFDLGAGPALATAIATGVSAIPEIAGAGRFVSTPARVAKAVPEPSQIKSAREASEATGIDLFEGQQTLSGPTLERQSFVQQLPAGVQKASKALEAQNKQASAAVDNILSQIAPDESIFQGADRFRSASIRAIEKRKLAREERASPLYKSAFGEQVSIDTGNVSRALDDISSEFPESGEVAKSLAKARRLIDEGGDNLRKLHNAKIEIDQMLSKVGDGSLGNTTKAKLRDIKNRLLDEMDAASNTYRSARKQFAADSPDIEALESSIIGKVAGLSDTQLKSVSRQIFDPQNVNTKAVIDAKNIISEVDSGAWDMLMRAEIERRMGSIKPELGGSIENIPGKLSNAIFGVGRQRDVLLAGASGETKKALLSLDTALRRAGLGREQGSQTASRTEISKELRGGIASGIRDLFRSPMDTIIRTGEDAAFNRRVSALSDALFDPRYKAETTKLINSGRGSDLYRLILSIEALKIAEREGTEEQYQ